MTSTIIEPITAGDRTDRPTAGDRTDRPTASDRTDRPTAGDRTDRPTAGHAGANPTAGHAGGHRPATTHDTAGQPITTDDSPAESERRVDDEEGGVDDEEGDVARFVRVEYPLLVAALGLVCGDRAAAEDAVQEALAKAVVAGRRGQRIESLPAWVRVVATNLLRNRGRSLGRERLALRRLATQQTTTGAAGGADSAVAVQQALDVQQALARLSRRQREAVALHYRLGLSVADTAATMGVAAGTVKTLLSRARGALAAALADPDGDHA